MKYCYVISAIGSASEEDIKTTLESIGLTRVFVEKQSDSGELIKKLDGVPCDDIKALWTKVTESDFVTNSTLKTALKEMNQAQISTVRDVAEAIILCCEKNDISDAYATTLVERMLREL